jgi:hypothetical protein
VCEVGHCSASRVLCWKWWTANLLQLGDVAVMRNSPILCARKVRRITVVNDGEISGIVSLKTLYKVAWEVPCHYRRAWRLVGTVPLVVSVDLTGHFAEHSDEAISSA